MGFEEFEGEEIWLGQLAVAAFKISMREPLRKGDEVVLVVRASVGEIAFPDGDTPVRVHKSKVVRREVGKAGITVYAVMVDDLDERERLLAFVETGAVARDGGQMRFQADGDHPPDWMREEPTETNVVELGDGPARAKRRKRNPPPEPTTPENGVRLAAQALDADIGRALGEEPEDETPEEGYVEPGSLAAANAVRSLLGEPPMTDEEWEASGGRVDDDA